MPSIGGSRWIVSIFCSVIFISAQIQGLSNSPGKKVSSGIDVPSIPVHNDTSRDKEGADHDTEPLRNNGRGSHEANAQNLAAESNGTHGQPVGEFQRQILEQHNKFRRQMCAGNLQADEDLHRLAEKIAHDKANEKSIAPSNDNNENGYEIDTGDPSRVTAEMIVQSWYDENKKYSIQNETPAIHFSQLVWKNSKKLGVGHAYSGKKLYIVALYKPPGNIRGQFAANVGCGANGQLQA